MKTFTILIIEDNLLDIRLIKEMLKEIKSFNSDLISAVTLTDGIEYIQQNSLDIILLDLNLPDSTGIQTFYALMKITSTIPVVLVSGVSDVELSISLIKEGAQDYIQKQDLNSSLLEKTIQYALIRNQLEEKVKESEQRLKDIIYNIGDWVWEVNKNGVYTYSSNKGNDILGRTNEEIIGKTPLNFMAPEEAEGFLPAFSDILNKKMPVKDLENWFTKKDGNRVCLLTNGVPMYDKGGTLLGFRGVDKDITNRKLLEKELTIAKDKAEESDRLKTAFLANMSHEIRTPMNGILGFSELLKEPGLTGEEQQEYIRIIEKSGIRMLNIINDIVDISKIEAGLMNVDMKDTDINEKLHFIHSFFNPQSEEKGIQLLLETTLSTKEAIIKTDTEKFFSILSNLVKNAIKYSKKGIIKFGCVVKGQNLEFYVQDKGIGIPKNRQSVIFERFIQADIEDKMARQGAGLGLSISKAYVEMLGGKIWVESDTSIGSTFYFTLPKNVKCNDQNNIRSIVKPKSDDYQNRSNVPKLKILIAEDDGASELLISIIIKEFSEEIIKARTGLEVIEACRKNPEIDLILMDIQMPGINGYEATRQIRQFDEDVVIIAQTAFALYGDREKAIEAGCNDYITKPINKNKFLSLIENYF